MQRILRNENEVSRSDLPCLLTHPELTLSLEHDYDLIMIRLGVKFATFSRAGCDVGGNELAITDEHALDRVIFCRCIRLKRLDQIGQIHEVRHHSLFLSVTAMP